MKATLLFVVRRAVFVLAAFAFTTATHAQTIANPSFEANSLTVFPGYTFTAGNGPISGWSMVGSGGLNPASGNPFADNGAVPQGSNVAFVQSVNLPGDYNNGVSGLATIITGLTNGVSYTVSFRANSRTSSFYGAPAADWSLNNAEFVPFTAAPSVGGANAYYTVTGTFTATGSIAALSIRNQTAAVGGPADTAVLVDAFTIAVVPPVVTNTNDSGPGSLRQMLAYAATIPGANTVTFDPALSGATIVLASEIVITDAASVTVDAGSLPAGVTIDGGAGTNRIFTVNSGKNLALFGLTLTGGNGGGVAQNGNGNAIVNFGTLALTRCTLSGNTRNGGSGGAILNDGGTLSLTHCTLSANFGFNGGAIFQTTGALTLTHCTISGNQTVGDGGAIYSVGGTLTLTNSIVTGNNQSANIVGSPVLIGVNLTSGDPMLAPLAGNGGPTRTMLPLPGSPAIDAASVIGGLTTDQRGLPRNLDGDGNGTATPDIGAVEFQRVVVTTNADELDTPSSSGVGLSLREAIRDGADLAVFAPALNSRVITFITLFGGEIVLAKSVIIDATSLPAGLTLDGGPGANRLFSVSGGKSLALLGLTLTGGNGGGADLSGNGGAILNNGGTLALTRSTLADNQASAGGGAIYQPTGTLALTHCTLSGNQAAGAGGGAILSQAGTFTLTHCTLSGNSAPVGGAIYNQATLTLTHSIVAGNTVTVTAADIANIHPGTTTRVGANIVQDHVNANGATASGPPAINAPPLLAPLGDYGGPTRTMALQPGSPARNAASGSTVTSDQRGFPIVVTPDLGAYEAGTFTNFNAYIWETLPVTATAPHHASGVDFDGDGVTNGNEWLALTNAADPANYLRITEVFLATGDIHSRFPTVVGRSYQFEFKLDLASSTWTPIDGPLPGTGGIVTHIIGPVTGQPQLFFRLRVGP